MRLYSKQADNKRNLAEENLTTLTYAEIRKLISGIPDYEEENSVAKRNFIPSSPEFLDLNFPARRGPRR